MFASPPNGNLRTRSTQNTFRKNSCESNKNSMLASRKNGSLRTRNVQNPAAGTGAHTAENHSFATPQNTHLHTRNAQRADRKRTHFTSVWSAILEARWAGDHSKRKFRNDSKMRGVRWNS